MQRPGERPLFARSRDVLTRVDWTEGRHRRSLAEAAPAALRAGDFATAWLLADRLVRISGRHSALPYILRASALARLGANAEASDDLEQALAIDAENPLLQQALLSIGTETLRRKAAEILLATPEGLGHDQALSTVARDGITTILHASADEAGVTAHLRWRGSSALTLTWSDGARQFDLSITGAMQSGHPDFPYAASLALPWPSGTEAITLGPTETTIRCLVIPPILHRPYAAPPPAQPPAQPRPPTSGLLVIVPVHDDREATTACLTSLAAARAGRADWRIVIVEDASPDPEMAPWLAQEAGRVGFTLLRNPLNLGFARSVNRALIHRRPDEDVLLLNADTILPEGAIERLAAAVASDPGIGTATPLSNNGEDTSFPRRFTANPMPEPDEIRRLDAMAQRANAGLRLDMPNGVGFCLYIAAAVLETIGPLSLDYGRGYYEDVDFCLRAAEAGFRNVCAADVYIGHSGTRSFKGAKTSLVRANLARIETRFPNHRDHALAFHRQDPLKPAVRRLEDLLLRETADRFRLVAAPAQMPLWLVRLMAGIEGPGRDVVLARPGRNDEGLTIALSATGSGIPQNLAIGLRGPDSVSPAHIAGQLAHYGFSAVTLLDAFELDPAFVLACRQLALPLAHGHVSAFGFTARRAALAGTSEPLVAGPLAERAWRDAGHGAARGPKRPPRPAAPVMPASGRRGACLAILAETSTPADWALASTIGQAVARRTAGALVSFIGDPGEAAGSGGGVLPTGPMARAEATRWLERAEAGACLIASRAYGFCDPRAEAWPQSGMATAYFDPLAAQPIAEPTRLRLPLTASDEEAAQAVTDWFLGLTRIPPGAG